MAQKRVSKNSAEALAICSEFKAARCCGVNCVEDGLVK